MTFRQRLRTIVCCFFLQVAATFGQPMRPEQVQDLMRVLNEPKIARTNPADDEKGDAQKSSRRKPVRPQPPVPEPDPRSATTA